MEYNGQRSYSQGAQWEPNPATSLLPGMRPSKYLPSRTSELLMDQCLPGISILPLSDGTGYCGYPIPVPPLYIGYVENKTYFQLMGLQIKRRGSCMYLICSMTQHAGILSFVFVAMTTWNFWVVALWGEGQCMFLGEESEPNIQ